MLIGIVSDLHRKLAPEVYEALEGCDQILCAGDTETGILLTELGTIAPLITIRGNCDGFDLGDLPFSTRFELDGVRFFMVHRPQDIHDPGDVDVVVHGHTHIPRNERVKGILYLNPGSPTRPRGGSKRSIAFLEVKAGKVANLSFRSFG
jgi:putative phosphoesterase